MFSFVRQLLTVSNNPQPVPSEQAVLLAQIKQTLNKLDQAWRNFKSAQPEFIDVAIMDIHNAENEFSVLNTKLRLLAGDCKKNSRFLSDSPRSQFPWLLKNDRKSPDQKSGC